MSTRRSHLSHDLTRSCFGWEAGGDPYQMSSRANKRPLPENLSIIQEAVSIALLFSLFVVVVQREDFLS